jgi:hypothetical protein
VVREEDAVAFVADVEMLLASQGKFPVVARGREVWVMRLGALLLAELGIGGGETTEETDG